MALQALTEITYYYARGCLGCRVLSPWLSRVARKYHVKIRKVNADKCGKACRGIKYVPTIKIGKRAVYPEKLIDILEKRKNGK